jgi:hypothetical protein
VAGELIYDYAIQSTGATSYGVPALDALLSNGADIPSQRARYDLAFRGPIVGRRLRGTIELTDYIHIGPYGKKIARYADGVAQFADGTPAGDLRENVTMTTSEPDYAWVNPLQVWALGTVDLAKGEAHVTGYAVQRRSDSRPRPAAQGPRPSAPAREAERVDLAIARGWAGRGRGTRPAGRRGA